MTGLAGLVGLFVFDLWAVISVLGSESGIMTKLVWVGIVVLLPVIGLVMWLIAGPGAARP